ncbi:hypothetical protein SCHPADRAFT_878628 [Schizopora paradoxa]|uniref:T6SS Phospholipase effector Tle1-like catalytic domain-containing protein n=1 Tax=Schizopora paradoxa TaxID=27342 RepID=A0A0H2RE57_9AGAM|nr:hypothetical protein SCHPADRAFT_878628 [Schizopora paradoxa]
MSSPPAMDEAGKTSGSSDDSGVQFDSSSPPPSFDALRTVSSPSQLESGHQESSLQFLPSSTHSSPGLKHVSLPKVHDVPGHRDLRQLRLNVSTLSTTSVDTATSLNTEYNGPLIPPTSDSHFKHRTVVICFDGTGDEFDMNNSNIVQFFSVLKKGDRKRQIVYYQSGIGTYTIPQVATKLYTATSKTLDLCFAKYLNFHVMGGYKFLMENYKEGDRICIFGFSRGAYTARALAGMIHKVGLLPAGNEQQVPFAYKMYRQDTELGWKQSVLFKKTFSIDVDIEFVGVWDTVASVGIIPQTLPFTKSNNAIKTFRHALSLDEHRVKFTPSLHQTLDPETAKQYDYVPPPPPPSSKKKTRPNTLKRSTTNRLSSSLRRSAKGVSDLLVRQSEEVKTVIENTVGLHSDDQLSPDSEREHLEQQYLDRSKPTDTLEVWFAGCHCDVGGGSVDNGTPNSLARIPLRWMIRECFRMKTGIQFEADRLYALGIDPHTLYPKVVKRMNVEKPLPEVPQQRQQQPSTPPSNKEKNSADASPPPAQEASALSHEREHNRHEHHRSLDGGTLVEHHREMSVAQTEEQIGDERVLRTQTSLIDEKVRISEEELGGDEKQSPPLQRSHHHKGPSTYIEDEQDREDAKCPVYDQLKLNKWWWILEFLPLRERMRQPDGTWKKKWILNRGRPRKMPDDQTIRVHRTVKMRMETPELKYKPRARWPSDREPVWVD